MALPTTLGRKWMIGCVMVFGLHSLTYAQVTALKIDSIAHTTFGVTYRVYACMKNEGEKVLAVFGDSTSVLSIQSDQPFYQHPAGSALSVGIRRNKLQIDDALRYDSWLTIGYEDNYLNQLKSMGLEIADFENQGAGISIDNGAWYCLPSDAQTTADSGREILLMQLTSKGKIWGNLSFLSQSKSGETRQQRSFAFQSF